MSFITVLIASEPLMKLYVNIMKGHEISKSINAYRKGQQRSDMLAQAKGDLRVAPTNRNVPRGCAQLINR